MKILQIHSSYKYRGGEERVIELEKQMLEKNGHEVVQFIRENKEIDDYTIFGKAALFWNTTWNFKAVRMLKKIVREEKPDICHVHNMVPLISPAIFRTLNKMQIPVVMTLHNYRLVCPNVHLYKKGRPCTQCVENSSFRALISRCYRKSFIQTLALSVMLEFHKAIGTFNNRVDGFICLSKFMQRIMLEDGIPYEKLYLKPNFIPRKPKSFYFRRNYVYAGRLEEVKGINSLIEASERIKDFHLDVIGRGEMKKDVIRSDNINYYGYKSNEEVQRYIDSAKAVIFPSKCFEGMPMVILEAFAAGIPVMASNHGVMMEMIQNGYNGILFEPRNVDSLIEKIEWVEKNPEKLDEMGLRGYETFHEKFSEKVNYKTLMDIYNSVIEKYRSDE